MGKLGRGRMALALVLFGLCCLVVGSPTTAETAGGWRRMHPEQAA